MITDIEVQKIEIIIEIKTKLSYVLDGKFVYFPIARRIEKLKIKLN